MHAGLDKNFLSLSSLYPPAPPVSPSPPLPLAHLLLRGEGSDRFDGGSTRATGRGDPGGSSGDGQGHGFG